MPVLQCRYQLCYDNDNQHQLCMRDTTSFDFTGVCEYIQHCDEYECGSCERFGVCTKPKKDAYLEETGDPGNDDRN